MTGSTSGRGLPMTSPERRFRRGAANDEQEAFILLHQCGLGTAQRHRNHMAGMQPGHDGLRAHELPPSAPVRAAAKTPFGCCRAADVTATPNSRPVSKISAKATVK